MEKNYRTPEAFRCAWRRYTTSLSAPPKYRRVGIRSRRFPQGCSRWCVKSFQNRTVYLLVVRWLFISLQCSAPLRSCLSREGLPLFYDQHSFSLVFSATLTVTSTTQSTAKNLVDVLVKPRVTSANAAVVMSATGACFRSTMFCCRAGTKSI